MVFALVVLCFCLSGFAALLYQTAWMRLFAIAFGTSEVATAVVLAGYMGGLAMGAALAARYIHHIKRPVFVYGVLEGGIALAALFMPLVINLTIGIYTFFVGGQPVPPDASGVGQTLFYVIASFLILLIPTALMGATLPLLARYAIRSNSTLGSRISLLYGVNTLGAVGGTLAAGFVFLPMVGLKATVWIGVFINLLVFVLAVVLAKRVNGSEQIIASGEDSISDTAESQGAYLGNYIKPLILVSGALSFIYEVLWTRMLSHVLGSSVYAFSTMLAAFLTGIALGAAAAGFFSKRPRIASLVFVLAQIGTGIASAFVYLRLEEWSGTESSLALFAFATILPSAVFIGATYPLAVRILAGSAAQAGEASARVYSWNTVGAILGALAGGFWIIPQLGFASTLKFAVLGNFSLALIALWFSSRSFAKEGKTGFVLPSWLEVSTIALGVLAITFLFQPQRPDSLVTRVFFGGSGASDYEEVYYGVGRSSTVFVTENPYRFDISTNGLPEAQIEFKGAPPAIFSQRWLGLWPSLARPDAKSILVVGLGGGVVLEGVPDQIEEIQVVELEPEVVTANRLIGDRRQWDPLSDSRFRVSTNDARNALRLTGQRYDAIVSQPSHPWTAGASHLFTREFFELVKSRLTQEGVFVQWMNAEFLDETLLRRLVATLKAEFDYVRVYRPNYLALHFIASNEPLDIENQIRLTGRPIIDDPEHFQINGISGPADLVAVKLLDQDGVDQLAEGFDPITDDDNRMALDTYAGADGLTKQDLTALLAPWEPLLQEGTLALSEHLYERELPYIAQRMLLTDQSERLDLIIERLESSAENSAEKIIVSSGRSDGLLKILQAQQMSHLRRTEQARRLLSSIEFDDPFYDIALYQIFINSWQSEQDEEQLREQLASLGENVSTLSILLHARQLRDQERWSDLKEFDTAMAQIPVTEPWAKEVNLIRAEWRLRAPETDIPTKQDAARLLEPLLIQNAVLENFWLRAELAFALENWPVFIESVATFQELVSYRIWDYEVGGFFPREEQEMLRDQLENFVEELGKMLPDDSTGRIAAVLAGSNDKIQVLNNMLPVRNDL